MKIAYNPQGGVLGQNAPLANDIIFDLHGLDIWARGVKIVGNTVTSTLKGLVPNFGTAAAGTIDSQANDWVLTKNDTGTVGWYKLPANAFNNTTYSAMTADEATTGTATTARVIAANVLHNKILGMLPSVMTGATSSAAGTQGLVPAPAANKHLSFLRGDGTWVVPTNTTYSQATTSALGLVKLMRAALTSDITVVAAPTSYGTTRNYAVDLDKDGQMFVHVPWGNTTYAVFTGATSSTDGAAGLVKQPLKADIGKFLKGDGTWSALNTSNVIALTSYSKATTAGDLATTDSLNTALGKLEYKADYAYDFIVATMSETNDSNTTIDRLKEVFDVLSGITETDTIKTLVSKYLLLTGGTLTGTLTARDITPSADDTYSLGTSSVKWANVYATTFTGNLTGTASVANKLGTANKGSATKPIYLAAGVATECNTYAGGTAVTLNGTSKAASTASFYAPTSVGTDGFVLKSSGSGAPTWVNPSTLTVGLTTDLKGGATGSIPYQDAENSTVFLAAPTTNGYVLKYNTTNKAPYWAADIDTNTWRKIQLNGTDILGSATNTNALNFVAGSNVTINNSNGTLTISSSYTNTDTWRNISVQNSSGTSLGSLGSGTNTGALTLKAGSNVTLSFANGVVTIASSYTNTDTKVTQTLDDSTNANLRLLLTPSALTATSTTTAKFATDLTYNPSTNTLTTPNLMTVNINGEKVYKTTEKIVSIALKKTWSALTSIDFTSSDFDGDGSYIVQVKNDNYGVWTGYLTVRTSNVTADSTTDDEIILQGGSNSGYNRPYLKTINTTGKVQLSMAYNVDLNTETNWYFYFKRII